MLHYLCQQICSVDTDLKIFNNPVQHNSGKISAQRFEISPQWFSERLPEKALCLIVGHYETFITIQLFI